MFDLIRVTSRGMTIDPHWVDEGETRLHRRDISGHDTTDLVSAEFVLCWFLTKSLNIHSPVS